MPYHGVVLGQQLSPPDFFDNTHVVHELNTQINDKLYGTDDELCSLRGHMSSRDETYVHDKNDSISLCSYTYLSFPGSVAIASQLLIPSIATSFRSYIYLNM